MADSKVTDLPAASSLTGSEVVYLVQAGLDVQSTAQDIANLSANGDVVGPASSTDNAIARYDSITGKLIQNSLVTVNDSGVLGANGANLSGNLNLATTTSSRALVTDGSKNAVSSATTATEIGYVNGVTSALQTQIDGKQASGNYITALTGEVTASGPGSAASTVTNSAVIGKVLTGFSVSAGTVAATDTILQAFNKIVGNIAGLVSGVSSVFGRTGAVTAQSGDYTTAIVADSSNKRYVTDAQLVVIGNTSGTNTGDQTITLTGAVTGIGTGSFATTIATPGTLSASSSNSTATAHTHAITSSSAPGAAASLLATDASGIIGSTGTRIVKGWFTDITVTNAIVGSVTGNAATATALQNARTIGGVSFDGTANITVSTATGGFTISGGDLALGANNITTTGSLGATGARLTKGWFTDLQCTNAIAGSITGNAATVTTNANLTGPITSSGNATAIASQTGTGTKFVVDTSPTLITPILGVATATTINGASLDNVAWTSYTPTITAGTGTFTTVSATGGYKQIGKTVFVRMTVTITLAGTATGAMFATVPTASVGVGYNMSGRENALTGNMLQAYFNATGSTLSILTYANATTIATGASIFINGTYEAA